MITRHSWLLVGPVSVLAACHSGQSDWAAATKSNTVAAYQTFLKQHPNDPHDTQARERIGQLEDEAAWNQAQVASTVEGYQQYLATEPQGAHAQEARDQVVSRQRSSDLQKAQQANTAEALQAFIQKYPGTDEAEQARTALDHLASYRTELASAHSRSAADRERRELARRFAKELPQVVVLTPDASAPEYRVTSGPMTQQDANAACQTIMAAHHSCKVIQAPAQMPATAAAG
jgi:hypothetical protein